MTPFPHTEKHLSQLPALQLLANLGYRILRPQEALQERQGKTDNVLLEGILRTQLSTFNRIHYKGEEYHFSEANIQEAIQKLKNVKYDGLQKTNEAIYDLITLGTALEQTIEGNSKSFNLNYIDWKTPGNNVFHVVPECAVERNRSLETARPDIVLFVNGIPLAVIECKSPTVEIEQAVSQNIRNQDDAYIPKLFTYVQLVMGVNKNAAQYATVGTPAKFWGVWNEREDTEDNITALINRPLNDQQKDALFSGEFASARADGDKQEEAGGRKLTEQDKALYSLCRPERVLELTYRFILFDNGIKKIARYQQFFVVRSTMDRIKRRNRKGIRAGGVIWHTQGSGKSLSMVMLVRALALDTEIANPRIILVTDRDDLDKQLGNTFAACGLSKERATSGRNLVKHIKEKVGIITTLIHKFDKGWASEKYVDESPDIIVLVDESHRTNYGSLAAKMRQILPNACYLAFTGTPLLKEEKNSFARFGSLIEPHYSIRQAVKDKTVLPLLYESRHVEMFQDQATIDLWFDRHTSGLNKKQKTDLKKKYARAEMLNKSDRVIYMRAYDVSTHYRANWQGTKGNFKAQIVAPGKIAALKYHECLKDIGFVTSEVIISPPDMREGHEEVNEVPTDEVRKFWGTMMNRFGSEREYNKQLINRFKHSEQPEILIVVDKLLTGFDAPRNTVLYLCRTLRDHTLLQAIARVNRLHEGKDFGYIIDYVSVLGELDRALTMYDAFGGFDEEDLAGTLTSIHDEVQKLPQRYSDLLDVFREVKNKRDEEAYELFLADDERREDFYERLTEYSKTLSIALSTDKFIMETDEAKLQRYKSDLKRFHNLKKSVQLRYAETINYRTYELRIKKLLDTHIQANDVTVLYEPVNIFDDQKFAALKQGQGIHSGTSAAARADTIAYATKRVIREKMDEDPAFYEKFSKLIQQAIDDFKARRISDIDYLNRVSDLRNTVVSKHHEDVPETIRTNDEACAYYGMAKEYFENEGLEVRRETIANMAENFQRMFEEEGRVDFWNNQDAINKVTGCMDDYFYDELKGKQGIGLKTKQMDEIIGKTMRIAKSRRQT